MADMTLAVRLIFRSEGLDVGLGRAENSLRRFSDRGAKFLERMQAAVKRMEGGLQSFGGKWAALASTATVSILAKQVADMEHRYTMLGIQAEITREKIASLKDEIFAVARTPDIKVKPGEILAAVESIVEKTGDLGFAQENLRNIGLVSRATGAEGKSVGEILGEFQKMGITGEQSVMQAIDTLNRQGKAGAFTLQNLASLGPRAVTAYTATGRGGQDAVREMGAVLQVIRAGTGSAEMATTAWEALLRTLTDPRKIGGTPSSPGIERDWGVKVWDPAAKAQGREVLRPVSAIMKEVVVATKGQISELGTVFDAEAIRSFNAVLGEYSRTGGFASLDKYLAIVGDGAQTQADAATAAQDASASMDAAAAALERVSDQLLAEPTKALGNLLTTQPQAAVDKELKATGVGIGAMVLAGGAATLGLPAIGTGLALGGLGALGYAGYTALTNQPPAPQGAPAEPGWLSSLGGILSDAMSSVGINTAAESMDAAGRQMDEAGRQQQEAGQQQAQAAQEQQSAAAQIQGAAAQLQGAAGQAAAALATPIQGVIRVEVTGPGRVQSVARTSGTVDLSAGYTGGAMPEAAR